MKKLITILLVIVFCVTLVSCGSRQEETIDAIDAVPGRYEYVDLSGETPVYYVITLDDDLTFTVYESRYYSIIGDGNYTCSDGILQLQNQKEGLSGSFFFTIEGQNLIFREEGSVNFMYGSIPNGAVFEWSEE